MEKSCFLFGHANTPQDILPNLENTVEYMVSKGISVFYVGYHGNFDHLAAIALRAVKRRHHEIVLMRLLAYHPAEQTVATPPCFDGTFYPPLENIPRRYALVRANQYMVKTADSLICYVNHPGNTRELLNLAMRQKLLRKVEIHNLAVEMP